MTTGTLAAGLARACHPGPTVAVTAIMAALALSAGRGSGAAWVATAVLAGQLSVGWSNDYLDRADDRAPPVDTSKRAAKPVAAGTAPERAAGGAAVAALAVAVILSFASGWAAALAHLAGVAAAWTYNLGVKRTAASPLPYIVAFGLLPAFVTLGLPGRPWPAWWVMAAGALLGTAAHFANVLPDMDADLAAGIRGLPQRFGPFTTRVVAAGALLAVSLLLLLAPAGVDVHALPGSSAPGAVEAATALAIVGLGACALGMAAAPTSSARLASARGRGFFAITVLVAAADIALFITRGASMCA